jgi:hypothetical protein
VKTLRTGAALRKAAFFIRDLPFDFISGAPARYTSYDTQALHPISIVLVIRPGPSLRWNLSFSRKIWHFIAFDDVRIYNRTVKP